MTRVAVLYGGISAEREVSLASGPQCIAALREAGFEVTPIEVGDDLAARHRGAAPRRSPTPCSTRCTAASARMAASRACSTGSACPTPHSGVRASALAMDKAAAKAVFAAAGLPVAAQPRGRRRRAGSRRPAAAALRGEAGRTRAPRSASRSSATATTAAPRSRATGATAPQPWSRNYIPGRELTVAVMGDRALAVTEIIADAGAFYDYEAKYADGGSRHIIPAPVHPDDVRPGAWTWRCAAHRALGCRGASRCRLPLRRHRGRARPAGAAGGQHPARPDAAPRCCRNRRRISASPSPQLCAWMVEQARHGA